MSSLLEVHGVSKRFGSVAAVDDVSLHVDLGERVALLGPNGSGKTTLFNLVSGVLPSDGGRVEFDGRDVTGWATHRLARHGLVRTFQHTSVFPGLSVERSLDLALDMTPRARRHRTARSAEELMEICRLTAHRDELGSNLPYGTSRLLNIALAMAAQPVLLMVDEPAAGLNDWETAELRSALDEINQRGVALLVIDHDMPFISGLCERATVLSSGSVLFSGTLSEVRDNPEVRLVYLGDLATD